MFNGSSLFRRAILQSGTPAGSPPPVDIKDKEKQYLQLLEYCSISKDDPLRLQKLRDVPIEKLIAAITDLKVLSFSPWAEEGFFPIAPNYSNQSKLIDGCTWVEEIIIGDGVNEVSSQAGIVYERCLISEISYRASISPQI